ncbi:MAG: T9SS type A sorting domain-containing protein [Crocinitomix sp.]|nr:T9SS type A sorting domain-containing protein [Crocinitomix sp.]
MRGVILGLLLSTVIVGYSQERDTLKVMSYNLLNFPSISPNRIDTLKKIVGHIQPDIFMVCELTSGAGGDDILFNALNEDGVSSYDMADYVSGPDTQNQLYFNSDKLSLYEQNEINTVLRDINEYVLYYNSTDLATTLDTTFFYIYVCHLKASSGNEDQRNVEVTALKTYLNGRPNAENIIIGGDFNFYGSDTEPAWNTLLTGGGVIIKDPLILPGHWHADAGFAYAHTQSTRTTSFDTGAFGGMDDRFDFIFIGEDLKTYSNDAIFINGSYRAIGQDGLHYDKSLIEAPTNTSEPSDIISALYHMSDHLPVYLEIEVVKEGAGVEEELMAAFDAFYNAKQDQVEFSKINLADGEQTQFMIYSITGQLIAEFDTDNEMKILSTEDLVSGAYILRLKEHAASFRFVKP